MFSRLDMIDWQLLAKEVHQANTDPMARDGNIYLQYGIMYVISDVCRMMEAGMDSRYAMEIASCDYEYDYAYALSYEYCIQGTLEGELADVAIRLLDLIAWGGWSIDSWVFSYNRNFLSNKSFLEACYSVVDVLMCRNEGEAYAVVHAFYLVLSIAKRACIDIKKHINLRMRYDKCKLKIKERINEK